MLWLTKKYILSISQRPQSHKYEAKSAQANSRITHTDRRTKTESAYLIYFQSHIPTSSSLFLSLSLKRKTISHPKSARRWENEKREEKKYNVPPFLRRGKSFRRGSLQTRRGNEIICADLRSCVFVINYGWWWGNTSESVGEDGEPTKCVIITTNRQTDKQNRRTPVLCCPKSNRAITISCSVEKDANIERQTDTEMDRQTKQREFCYPNSEAYSLTTILLMCVV